MKRRSEHFWQAASIKNKISIFIVMILLMIFMFLVLEFWVIRFSLVDFHSIIEGNSMSNELWDALDEEKKKFEIYVKDPNAEKKEELESCIRETERCVRQLPYEYEKTGAEIYRLTWNIRNAYEVYVEHRDDLLRRGDSMPNYIGELYRIYDMQNYLKQYTSNLNNENVYAGNRLYFSKYPWILGITIFVSILLFISVFAMMKLSKMMNHAIVHPLEDLADASRKIAENQFFIEDIRVENQDELGDLVQSFNRMKNAMGQYAQAVDEKRLAISRIHEQEMERVQMERQLEAAKLNVLVSQMNPHFLFNTLNVIAGMANLENADITEKMTRSLSTLLRYTVHNDLPVVPLKRELQVAEEYTYLQHMRFGARIRFQIQCEADTDTYEIPPFTLQPLIENAVIHGVAPKIEGGMIKVKVCVRGENLVILVADNGVGMSKDRLLMVRRGISGEDEKNAGVAFTNICRRFQLIYDNSTVEVFSKENFGTLVRIKVPVKEAACIGY